MYLEPVAWQLDCKEFDGQKISELVVWDNFKLTVMDREMNSKAHI